jgi:hypothetical protein
LKVDATDVAFAAGVSLFLGSLLWIDGRLALAGVGAVALLIVTLRSKWVT